MLKNSKHRNQGFTIVELLIVIVVIGILAAITIVAYNGIQDRAASARIMSDIRQVASKIEEYNAANGAYPSTGGMGQVYEDANCTLAVDSDGQKTAQWVPGIDNLPQNPGNLAAAGMLSRGGCYMYSSDGVTYVLSAWNVKKSPSTDAMYRRLGWRESTWAATNLYYCNHAGAIGGISSGVYSADRDYYKYSYTVSNITSCNETPPAGA